MGSAIQKHFRDFIAVIVMFLLSLLVAGFIPVSYTHLTLPTILRV